MHNDPILLLPSHFCLLPSHSMNALPPGKLPLGLLDDLLENIQVDDPRVLVGPRLGEDAAVIDFGDTCLVAKTDPITFATDEIGYYAIHVSANDIATMGATPRWFLPALLLPDGSTDTPTVRSIFASIQAAADDAGIAICGGHTEITTGLDRPIIVGQMLGEVAKDRLIRSDGLREGDRILMTKGLGVEGTALIARELGEELEARGLEQSLIERATRYLRDPGISVLTEARAICEAITPHAMHDPTEGGVATALRELAAASNVGLAVYANALFLAPETEAICKIMKVDPLGLISSGALLIGVDPADVDRAVRALSHAGVRTDVIARVESVGFGLRYGSGTDWRDLPTFDRDEIARLFP